MPYIKKQEREELNKGVGPRTEGELNYLITKIVRAYLGSDYNYAKLNSVIGVLESSKLELYRRMVVPHEEERKNLNGDVY